MDAILSRLLQCLCLTMVMATSLPNSSSFSCVGRTGFYPYPASCSHFIACVHGREFVMSCPAGLHYSPSLKLCDWPTKASCSLPPEIIDSPEKVQCNLLCPPHVSFFQFPDWTDCSRHYVCLSGMVTGPHKCPDGLFYDFLTWSCAYKEDVICYNP